MIQAKQADETRRINEETQRSGRGIKRLQKHFLIETSSVAESEYTEDGLAHRQDIKQWISSTETVVEEGDQLNDDTTVVDMTVSDEEEEYVNESSAETGKQDTTRHASKLPSRRAMAWELMQTYRNTNAESKTASTSKNEDLTYSDVAHHRTRTDLMIIINDEIYDVTAFVDLHP